MEKIKYKNRFRVLDTNGKVLYLNSIINAKGAYQYVQGFETLVEAQTARDLWAKMRGKDSELFEIQMYSESIAHVVKQVSEQANNIIKKMHLFSGRGLKKNTITAPKDENKYKPDRFYGRDVWMFQSLERNKGRTTLPKEKKEKQSINDIETFERVNRVVNDGTFDLSFNLIESLRKHNFPNRKALKTHLKERNFTNRQINAIIPKYYYS